jgi:hypothetical protein
MIKSLKGLNLVSSNILDGNGVKPMPGLILVHYRKIRKIQVSKWGTPKKNIEKITLLLSPRRIHPRIQGCQLGSD